MSGSQPIGAKIWLVFGEVSGLILFKPLALVTSVALCLLCLLDFSTKYPRSRYKRYWGI